MTAHNHSQISPNPSKYPYGVCKIFRLIETGGAEFGFFGELNPIVGNGKSETLNYGTGQGFSGKPMLYVPILRGESTISNFLTSARHRIAHTGIECHPDSRGYGGWTCQAASEPHKADIMHTGEAHVTVALGDSLRPVFGDLKSDKEIVNFLKSIKMNNGTPLFDSYGNGINMPIEVARPAHIVYGVAKNLTNSPLVALLPVICHRIDDVRQALRLPPLPPNYTTHITIGYAYGIRIGDLLTTDSRKGQPPASTSFQHDTDYKKLHGVDESVFKALGITEFLIEEFSD